MEAAATLDPTVRTPPSALLREPLAWAALAAFVGSAVGLAGTFAWAAWEVSLGAYEPLGPMPSPPLLASWGAPAGGLLTALSLLGVAALLGRRSWAGRSGVILLLLWLSASLCFILYSSLWPPDSDIPSGEPPIAFLLALHASVWLGSVAVLPSALGALLAARKRWLGTVLLVLSVPGLPLMLAYYNLSGAYPSSSSPTILLGLPGAGVGVPEAVLWVLLGLMLLDEARLRALSKVWQEVAEENRRKARRIYEGALGRGDLSVVEELASEDFRDLRHGVRGGQGMRHVVLALRESFPDLAVSIEEQEAKEDVVRTRLRLSGTDQGGVLWFLPTGRRVSFSATFEDRFSGGRLVEHGGSTDTEGLLRQLGHPKQGELPGQ